MAGKNDAADEDLEGLQLAINEKSDETLDCTRRMREMCAEAKDSGMKTLIALDDQEELIDKFEAAADGINADMALAEKALKVGCCMGSTKEPSCSHYIMDCCLFLLLQHLHHSTISLRTSSFLPFFLYVCFNFLNPNKIKYFAFDDIKDYRVCSISVHNFSIFEIEFLVLVCVAKMCHKFQETCN